MSRTIPTPGRDEHARTARRMADGPRIAGAVGVGEVEESALARCDLARIDYVDQFVLTPVDGSRGTAEEWARAMFGDVPTPGERFIWKGLLRLRIRQGPSPSTVAGWRIAHRDRDWIRLETASGAQSAQLVIRATADTVSLTTFIQNHRFVARVKWTLLSAVHRKLAPGVLRAAAATTVSGRSGR